MPNDSLLEFPCLFPLKIMGRNTPEFKQTVIDLIAIHIEGEYPIVERPSKDANFVALTIELQVISQEQLDAIYRSLTSHESILMVL